MSSDQPADQTTPVKRSELVDRIARRYAVGSEVIELPADLPDGAQRLQTMLDHRTCRTFDTRPVSDALLDLVLAATFSTPSKSDLQQCSVIVVDDLAKREALAALVPSMPWIASAPRFLVFCGDSRRMRSVTERAGHEFANDHLDAFLNAAADAAMHLSSFIWAAETVGLGTCPISVLRNHIDDVAAIVELPDHVFPLAGICVGWPGEASRRLSPRLPLSVTVHRDRYDDCDAGELIADYDRRRYGDWVPSVAAQPESTRFGAAETWGWSIDKARRSTVRERDQLARFLREAAFDLD